jgi:hypothetical protein
MLEGSGNITPVQPSQKWIDANPRINFHEVFNYISKQVGSVADFGYGRQWKLKSHETYDFQKAILQHERLADHLKVKTYWKR